MEGFRDSRQEVRSTTNGHEEKERVEEPEGLRLRRTGALTQSVDYWFSGTEWP